MARNPQQSAKKWAERLGASTGDIQRGVDAVAENPCAKAAAAESEYIQGVQRGVGKWKRNLERVSKQDWQAAMKNKAIPRIAAGAQNAVSKMGIFFNDLLPYQESLKASLPPKTKANSQARMIAWMEGMKQFRANGSGGGTY